MKTIIALIVTATACGGGNSTKPTTPIKSDPIPMTENPAKPDPDGHDGHDHQHTKSDDPPKPDQAKIKAELLATETTAYEKAKPVFDKFCSKCHSKNGNMTAEKKRDHFDMTTYPFGGHHAMELGKQIRKSLGINGEKPTMPFDKKGSVKGEDLALIAAWADAFDASHAGGAHDGHGDHHHDDDDHDH